MALEALAEQLPAYARDVAQNLLALEQETPLTVQQLWGAFVASSHAVAEPSVIQAIEAAAIAAGAAPLALDAARGAAAVMAQNNVYFRALSLMKNQTYRSMRSRLRMDIVRRPGVDDIDFHLWCVAVSAVYGCADCLDAHEGVLARRGVDPLSVQTVLRIAAATHAASRVLAAERGRAVTRPPAQP